jgi:PAS domain S-box-containing protein
VIQDIGGRIIYWNQSAARMFGLISEDVVGRPIHEVLGIDKALSDEATARVLASGEWRRVVGLPGPGGRQLLLDSHLTLVRDEAGRPKSILTINTDITARVAMEERLRRTERLEAVGQLTGGVAHDFNNLLTVILGNAEALNEELADRADLLGLGEMIGRAAARGAALTHQLLAFAQRQTLDPRPIDPRALLSDMSACTCGPGATRERPPEPLPQRQGCHAARRNADDRNRECRARPGLCGQERRRGARRLCQDHGDGQRNGHIT